MADARAWLPPEGPAHGADYDWYDAQGAHRIGNSTVNGHEDVILTRSEIAQRNCERYGLEELPEDATEKIAEAREEGDDERTARIVAEYRSGAEDVAGPEEVEDDAEGVPDPDDLTVDEIEDRVGDLDTNDLIILREVEKDGKNRDTAIGAIDSELGDREDGGEEIELEEGDE